MLFKLINEGKQIEKNFIDATVTGDSYEIWLNACINYLEIYHRDSALTKKFIKEYEEGTQQNNYYFKTMLHILEGLKKIEDITPPPLNPKDCGFF